MKTLLAITLIAVGAPWLAPQDPDAVDTDRALEGFSRNFPLGTDPLGRCLLSRALFATRLSFGIAAAVVTLASVVGMIVGGMAGYLGGWTRACFGWLSDFFLAFPGILIALAAAALFGRGFGTLIVALVIASWVKYARVTAQIVEGLRHAGYISAARAIGASPWFIVRRHLAPTLLPPIMSVAALGAAHAILSAAALSFLGLGVPAPAAEWGAMIAAGRPYLRSAPHLTVIPGIGLALMVAALQSLVDRKHAA